MPLGLSIKPDISANMTPLDVPTAILERRSTRNFKPDPIPSDILHRLIELTVAAPSSWNLQDWRIIVVQDEGQRQALAKAAFNQRQIAQAPVTVVFAADTLIWQDEDYMTQIYTMGLESGAWPEELVAMMKQNIPRFQEGLGDKVREYAIKDAMIAATQMSLAAQSLGLTTCYMNGWIEPQVKEIIGAADQDNIVIALLLPIGYAEDIPGNPGRLPLSTNVFVDNVTTPYSA
jgi:nitroreductase